jgi:hypothetical protein
MNQTATVAFSSPDNTIDKRSLHEIELLSQFQEKLSNEKIRTYVTAEPASSMFYPERGGKTATNALPLARPGIKPVLQVATVSKKIDRFNSFQKWEGIVLEVREDCIIARINDLDRLNTDRIEEEAQIPISEIDPEDVELVKPGSIFYWNIGYWDTARGQRIRSSLILFQRVPYITKKKIEGAAIEAEQVRELISWI